MNRKTNRSEFLKMYINIVDDVEIIINSKSTRHRQRMVEVLSVIC